jgi:hypothetical protein
MRETGTFAMLATTAPFLFAVAPAKAAEENVARQNTAKKKT